MEHQIEKWMVYLKAIKEISSAALLAALLAMVLYFGLGNLDNLFRSIDANLTKSIELEQRRIELQLESNDLQRRNSDQLNAALSRLGNANR